MALVQCWSGIIMSAVALLLGGLLAGTPGCLAVMLGMGGVALFALAIIRHFVDEKDEELRDPMDGRL